MKVILWSQSRIKDGWLKEPLAEYQKRLRGSLELSFIFSHDLPPQKGTIALDPSGKALTSLAFSQNLEKELSCQGGSITLLIGPADGLSKDLSYPRWSLSTLTFSGQLALLLATEQVYRAVTLWKGSPYAR